MIRICFLGIFIGTFSLMMTLIIMHGFEETIHEKMQGINADITILPPTGNKLALEQIRRILLQNYSDDIQAVSGSNLRQVIIDKDGKQSVVFLKGIEPEHEEHVSSLAAHISTNLKQLAANKSEATQSKNADISSLLMANNIVIGYKIAQNFGLTLGDKLTLYIPEPTQSKKIYLQKKEVVIAGFIKVGLDEFDQGFAYASLDLQRSLFSEKELEGVDSISLKQKKTYPKHWWQRLYGPAMDDRLVNLIKPSLSGMQVTTWKKLYPALVSSLKLEKYVMFFILALITLVASLNMISLLVLHIQQKRRDIAIFHVMGMRQKTIQAIFLRIGMIITILASSSGLALAALCGWLLEKYPCIQLPDVYYVSHLPARMSGEIFAIVFIATVTLGWIATYLPARRTKTIDITSTLRSE